MEALQAIISSLYTTFILRDFVGKVIPGGLVLFSVATFFARPSRIVKFIVESRVVVLVFLVSVSWTLMLGLQGVPDSTGIWNKLGLEVVPDSTGIWKKLGLEVDPDSTGIQHYPDTTSDGKSDIMCGGSQLQCEYVEVIRRFYRNACPDDKLMYERFEVIKEACRNLLMAVIISIFPIGYYGYYVRGYFGYYMRRKCVSSLKEQWPRTVIFVFIIAITGPGLFLTARQHADRERDVLQLVVSAKPCSKASPKAGTEGS